MFVYYDQGHEHVKFNYLCAIPVKNFATTLKILCITLFDQIISVYYLLLAVSVIFYEHTYPPISLCFLENLSLSLLRGN